MRVVFEVLHSHPLPLSLSRLSPSSSPSRLAPSLQTLLLVLLLALSAVAGPAPVSSAQWSAEQKAALRRVLLSHFGLADVAGVGAGGGRVPDYLWREYEDNMHTHGTDWIRHYYPQSLSTLENGLLVSFNLSVSVRDAMREQLESAHLKTRVRGHGVLRVFDVDGGSPLLVDALPVSTDQPSWLDVDVTAALARRRPDSDQFTLLLSLSGVDLEEDSSPPLALLVRAWQDEASRGRGVRRRARRSASQEEKSRRPHRKGHRRKLQKGWCRREQLYVDFEEIGWKEWIQAPSGYEAGQCAGGCGHPLPNAINATNHAIVQTLLHSINPEVPPACCVPTEMSDLSIMYRDLDDKFVIKNYPDMKVDACGCR